MPRICGVLSENAEEASRLVATMANAMRHSERDAVRVWSLPGLAVGLVVLKGEDPDLSFREDDTQSALVCGTIREWPSSVASGTSGPYEGAGSKVLRLFRAAGSHSLVGE